MADRERIDRRTFLVRTAAVAAAAGTGGLSTALAAPKPGFGPLRRDSGGILDLPAGFQYRILSAQGSRLPGGARVPGRHDGMAAFAGPRGATVLVRNHELESGRSSVPGVRPFDPGAPAGTIAIVVGPDRRQVDSYVTSSGALRLCAGGATPWGTWLTCEETTDRDHGYVFEVPWQERESRLSRTPIRAFGVFSHEAVAVDPATGIVYLTEDDGPSFLYRCLPRDRSGSAGSLLHGGRLQALGAAKVAGTGRRYATRWVDVNPLDPRRDAFRKDAFQFQRLEGCWFSAGVLWFSDTRGGADEQGQIYRYRPGSGRLELFYEARDGGLLGRPDNLVVTPWGDLWCCEDGKGTDEVVGLTPGGAPYVFARGHGDSELAGACFAPDGRTFFVNIQDPGLTLAIWGPFPPRQASQGTALARSAPRGDLAPAIAPELAEAARRNGLAALEAAAFDRLGVPL